jgi:hypothetical protein
MYDFLLQHLLQSPLAWCGTTEVPQDMHLSNRFAQAINLGL